MMVQVEMKARALAEFDRMAESAELNLRVRLARAGHCSSEIERAIELCRPGLGEQRAKIGQIVTVALLKAGVPIEGDRHEPA